MIFLKDNKKSNMEALVKKKNWTIILELVN